MSMRKRMRKRGLSPFLCNDPKGSIPGVGALVPFLLFFIFCFTFSVEAEKGLVAWWKFDEGKGDVLNDSSGNENHAKIHEATWYRSAGGKNYSLLFDKEDAYITCRNFDSLRLFGYPLTISIWINLFEIAEKEMYILTKWGWSLFLRKGNDVGYIFRNADGDDWIWFNSGTIPAGKWSHLVSVHSIKDKKVYAYINGNLVNTLEWTEGSIGDMSLVGFLFGRYSDLHPQEFRGLMSETKVYNRDLSAEEVERNYELELKTKNE